MMAKSKFFECLGNFEWITDSAHFAVLSHYWRGSTEDIWELCLQYWPQGIMTLPPLILIHQCIFYTEYSFPCGYRWDFPIPLTIECIWILPLKQHCGWNLISWSDTAKCLSAFVHKLQNNMKGILEVPNKRIITNTKHSYDIYF